MITLKTINKHTFLNPNGVNAPIEDYIYLQIDRPNFFGNAVTVEGYYYFLQNDEPVRLREIHVTPMTEIELNYLQENAIPRLGNENIFALMRYLAENLAIMKLQQEATEFPGANWGITGNGDIEIYVEQQQE